MSSVRLLKPDRGDKAGSIVTRPFHEANKLVAAGIAERLGPKPPVAAESAPVPSVPQGRFDAEVARREVAEADNKNLRAENELLNEEIKELKAKLAAAEKRAAEAEKKLGEKK